MMELFWIVFITVVAATLAYFIGGIVDKRAYMRQQAYEAARSQQWLSGLSAFSRTFANRLVDRAVIAPEAVPGVCCELYQFILESKGQQGAFSETLEEIGEPEKHLEQANKQSAARGD